MVSDNNYKFTVYWKKYQKLFILFVYMLIIGMPFVDARDVSGYDYTQSFTSSGTFTVPTGVTTVYITAWGAGGSGAKLAGLGGATVSPITVGGGGSGEVTLLNPVTVTSGDSIIVTIGAGGTVCNNGCYSGSAGADGGATSFGDLLSVAGGQGAYGGDSAAYSGGGGGSTGAGRTLTSGTSGSTSGYRIGGSSGGGAINSIGYTGGSMNGNSGGNGDNSVQLGGGTLSAGGGAAGYGGAGTSGSSNGGSSSAAANSGAGTGGARAPSNVGTGGSGKLIVYWNESIKPTTIIELSGVSGNNGYFISNVQLTLTATDNEGGSGIAKTEYSLDNGVNWNQYINPFTISTEGTTTILYKSTDIAGNIEDQKTQTVNIDKTQPASITNLKNITYASTYINWTWTDPSDLDFDRVMIYLNGIFQRNVTNGRQYYNAIVAPGTYTIGTRTVDTSGNINATMKTHTATTILPAIRFINGTVIDSENRTGISGVTVYTNTSFSTITNSSGFYSFEVASGTFNLSAKFEPTYYENNTITVSTELSAVVMQDIELVEKQIGNITGSVTNAP